MPRKRAAGGSQGPAACVRKRPACGEQGGAAEAPQRAGDVEPPSLAGPMQLLNEQGSGRSKVLVIYTGGTIGMQDMGKGALGPIPGALVKKLRLVDELDSARMPQCSLVEFDPILDSADMGPTDWTQIAMVIEAEYYNFDGFVVLHGTDTLSYTASALSFMLEQLNKPVVITGAQLPFIEPLSDARQNFLGAVVFAGLGELCEVCVCFGGSLFRGNRTNKCDSLALRGFASPMYPALGELGSDTHIYRKRLREQPRGRFQMQQITATQIMVVWTIPGFSDAVFKPLLERDLMSDKIKGLVLLMYGCGNTAERKESFLGALEKLVSNGVVVVACSQSLRGFVDFSKYEIGKWFLDIGVISAGDMTTEATITKLAYLLSKDLPQDQVRRLMGEDLRGEMSADVTRFRLKDLVSGLTKC